ncbi:hypothetical protein LINPERPRIM_LOCUS11348, partial [Linum perenne]
PSGRKGGPVTARSRVQIPTTTKVFPEAFGPRRKPVKPGCPPLGLGRLQRHRCGDCGGCS